MSDRRVTYLITQQVMDSAANKAIIFGNSLVFGYTGLADLENMETSFWLTHVESRRRTARPLSRHFWKSRRSWRAKSLST